MTKGAMATLSAGVAVFGFDPEPGTPASRALHVLTVKRTLPTGDLGPKERFTEAALRTLEGAGQAELVPCPTIQATLDAVHLGSADKGVVPIESSVEGSERSPL